jgi:hypoxanthine-DNA glycosylase
MKRTSLPPVLPRHPRVLVLGSMPGERSLADQRYYAHPYNHFWPIMRELVGAAPELAYARRLARLRASGIALWDVLAHCERPGSLDSRIVRASEVANPIAELLATSTTLAAVALNGGKAQEAFRHHVLPALDPTTRARVTLLDLPSTSPANASIPYARKLERWRAVLEFLRRP